MKTVSERGVTIAGQPVNSRLVFASAPEFGFCITRDQRRRVYRRHRVDRRQLFLNLDGWTSSPNRYQSRYAVIAVKTFGASPDLIFADQVPFFSADGQ